MTEQSMVEKVAAEMKAARAELISQPLARIWPLLARAAIEAMREPTEAMMQAVWEARFDDKYNGSQAPAAHAMCVAMIDAALSTEER